MIIKITNEEEIKDFVNYFNNLNQLMKNNIGSEPYYIFTNNALYMNSYNQIIPYIKVYDFVYTKKHKKLSVDKYISKINHIIYFDKFFQFQKDNKKNIIEVSISEEELIFKCSESSFLKFDGFDGNLKTEFEIPEDYKNTGSFKINKEETNIIYDTKSTTVDFYINFENGSIVHSDIPIDNTLPLILHKKLICGLKKDNKINITVYYSEEKQNTFLIELILETKKYKVKNYFFITDIFY